MVKGRMARPVVTCHAPTACALTHLHAVPLLLLQVIQLPRWHGRVWQLLSDTSKVWLDWVGS